MTLTDEEFREEYKPLQIPAHYDDADTRQNKMIYALAQIGEGTADEVIAELDKLDPREDKVQIQAFVKTTLAALFNNGHLTGSERNGQMRYNLSKVTQANNGAIDPDLLAPGLD